MEIKQQRCSSFDLLKIVSMFLIVCFHCVYKGDFHAIDSFANQMIIDVFFYFGLLGVNCFALITGYFYKNMYFKKEKFIKILLQIAFYIFLSICVLHCTGHELNMATVLYRITPFDADVYWYGVAYCLLLLIAPYLNIMIENMSQEQHRKILIIGFVLFSVIPTCKTIIWARNLMEITGFYNRFIWVVFMYLLGSYIKQYSFSFINDVTSIRKLFLLSSFSLLSFIMITNIYNSNLSTIFFTPNSIFEILLSISLFGGFYHMKLKYTVWIHTLSRLTFGVYLFHDGLLDKWIWTELLKVNQYQNNTYMIFIIIFYSLLIFITGMIIEAVRANIERFIVTKVRKSS